MKCYFCDKEGIAKVSITVDAEADHDGDQWNVYPIKSLEPLCQDHLEAYDNGELYERGE